jgi:O-methyltransferase involved in polyketide biosynthesis
LGLCPQIEETDPWDLVIFGQGENMSDKTIPHLEGVSETLLITLYTRALESQRPDGLIRDEKAVEIVQKLDRDLSRFKLQGHDEVALILRTRQFDRKAREFLARNPDAVVVQIGCGLDTRFERVDDGRVEWFDLDLPDVIELRRKLIGREAGRYHLVSGSAFEAAWPEVIQPFAGRPFLFMAEGVFPYFEETQVRDLVRKLCERVPGAELVCDAHTPFVILTDNLQLAMSGVKARLRWGLKHGRDVEQWGDGISMLEEWFYFDDPEPRMASYRWMRHFPLL